MGKDPAFLFYPNDWAGGTMGMTFEEKGAYMELLIMQFNHEQFTEAQAKLVLSICSASAWEKTKHKFESDGVYYWNRRLREEITKRKKFSESRRMNASSKKKPEASAEHMHEHMENENEDIDIKKKGEYEGKKTKWLSNQVWMESFCMQNSLTLEEAKSRVEKFLGDLFLKNDINKSVGQMQSHFVSWMNKNPQLWEKRKGIKETVTLTDIMEKEAEEQCAKAGFDSHGRPFRKVGGG